MSSRRRTTLVLAPWLFLGLSYLTTLWVRTPTPPAWSRNEVRLAPGLEVPTISLFGPIPSPLSQSTQGREAEVAAMLGNGFRTWSAAPFVLGGDLETDDLRRLYRRTLVPACRALTEEYFEQRPDEPITILAFSSTDVFTRQSRRLFGIDPPSVYGYYRPEDRTVVVNLATGAGTLLHELTHALMDFDHPTAPAWLQEGLASLHEQGEFRLENGAYRLRGRINWRLQDLRQTDSQGEIQGDVFLTHPLLLEQLVTAESLRGQQEAVLYSLARHLCLVLQERGALASLYRESRETSSHDPVAMLALLRAFDASSLAAIDHEMEAWLIQATTAKSEPETAARNPAT